MRFFAFLAIMAFLPPIFFHFRLKRHDQAQSKKCGWLQNPPLVCAHGGDSSRAPPNTMTSYRLAIRSQVDCVEIDASRSRDGVLVALHDRDLQNITGDDTSKVGDLSISQVGYIVMKDPITGIQSDLLRMEGAEVIGVYHGLVNEKLVNLAHRAGKKVYAWTVDDIESMQKMLLVGVDSIITSQPNSLQKMIEYMRNQCMGVGF